MRSMFKHFAAFSVLFGILFMQVNGQTTAFSYQGVVKDNGAFATGSHDFEFRLYSAVSGGVQLGSTLSRNGVVVENGVFSVELDFGAPPFPGADRFLEIRVKLSAGIGFTTLSPRQKIGSAPYSTLATTALNAQNLGGVNAGNFVQSGASSINAGTQFNIGGDRVFHAPGINNTFAGRNAGVTSTGITTFGNTAFGTSAGESIGTGGIAFQSQDNSFFGSNAGRDTKSGFNSFFGAAAGRDNTDGISNSFFGAFSGLENNANNNSFFGYQSGRANILGTQNSFFGLNSGLTNVAGNENSYFGFEAGKVTTSSFNSFFGSRAGQANSTGSTNSFFGTAAGAVNSSGSDNSFFGVNTGVANSSGSGNTLLGRRAGRDNNIGNNNTAVGIDAGRDNTNGSNNTLIGAFADVAATGLNFATAIGSGAIAESGNSVVLGRSSDSVVVPGSIRGPGVTGPLKVDSRIQVLKSATIGDNDEATCFSNSGDYWILAYCGSSIRLKENVNPWSAGLELIKRLRPVTFDWKSNGRPSVGMIAEEVKAIDPILTPLNDDGTARSINYNGVVVALVNAVKEQQITIDSQQKRISAQDGELRLQAKALAKQQAEIDELQKFFNSLRSKTKAGKGKRIR